jgi:hypothetical protein
VTAQWRRYGPSAGARTFVFDVGYSHWLLCRAVGGRHYDVAAGRVDALAFQPLADVDQAPERAWAASWLETLLELQGVAVGPRERSRLDRALALLAEQPRAFRTLTELTVQLQDPVLVEALRPYTVAGSYGALLDAGDDALDDGASGDATHQVFELRALLDLDDKILVPTLLYLFRRVERSLDGRPTLIVIEELWAPLMRTAFASRIRQWLLTLRKQNATVMLVAHTLAQLDAVPAKQVLVESCPTRVLLPNPEAGNSANARLYRDLGLNDREIGIIAGATPKRDYYVSSPLGRRLVRLELGPVALAFLGTPEGLTLDAMRPRAEQLATQFGDGWAKIWIAERELDPPPDVRVQPARGRHGRRHPTGSAHCRRAKVSPQFTVKPGRATMRRSIKRWCEIPAVPRHRRTRWRCRLSIAAAILGLLAIPEPAEAQFGIPQLVYDPAAVAKLVTQLSQQIQQITVARSQLQTQLDNMRKLSNPELADDQHDRVADRRADSAGAGDLLQPGGSRCGVPADVPGRDRRWTPVTGARRAAPSAGPADPCHSAGLLNAAQATSQQFSPGTARLTAMKAQVGSIRSAQQAAELNGVIGIHTAEEITLLRQQLTAQASAQAVLQANQVNRDLQGAAVARDLWQPGIGGHGAAEGHAGRIRRLPAMSELSTTSPPGVPRPIAIWALLLATAVGAASSCQPKAEDVANGDDPIAALDARVRSTRYDGPYWQQQRLASSDVWRRAVATCTPRGPPSGRTANRSSRTPGQSRGTHGRIRYSEQRARRPAAVAEAVRTRLTHQGELSVSRCVRPRAFLPSFAPRNCILRGDVSTRYARRSHAPSGA